MSEVILTKSGLLARIWEDNAYREEPAEPLRQLSSCCEIAADVTLLDILEFIAADKQLLDLVAILTGTEPEAFIAEARRSHTPESEEDPLACLEIHRTVDISWWGHDYDSGVEGEKYIIRRKPAKDPHYDLECGLGFHGISASGTAYAIGLTPVYKLAHLPVRLREEAHVLLWRKRQPSFRDISARTSYTLLEVLQTILWELGWYGPPEMRDAELAELGHRAEEAEAYPERCIPVEFVDA